MRPALYLAAALAAALAFSGPLRAAALGEGTADVVLVDDTGKTVKWGELSGKPRALFFGFTNCPVICPVTVFELDNALSKIGGKAASVEIHFVTLDPARDTPSRMHEYFSGFRSRVRAFGGADGEIARLAKAFKVERTRVDEAGGGYSIDHTAAVFLLDEKGGVADTIAYGAPQDLMLERLRRLSGS